MNTICASRDHNPERFWSFFKTKSKVSNIPGKVSMKENDNERLHADNNTDIANMFNEYFASIFTSDSDSNSERQDHSQVITIDNIELSEEQVMAVIMNLDSNKAQGPDNIPARLLKETAMQITPSLCALFNYVLVFFLVSGSLQITWSLSINMERRLRSKNIDQFRCYHSSPRFSNVVYSITSNITFTSR